MDGSEAGGVGGRASAEEAVTREGVSEQGKVGDFEFHRVRGCFRVLFALFFVLF